MGATLSEPALAPGPARADERPGPAPALALYRGRDAEGLVAAPSFQDEWRRLHDACPWATVYQDVPFVTAWYTCYADVFEPLVVCESTAGRLTGVLFLAVSRASGELAQCGTSEAEYHVWLARPERGSAFLEAACTALREWFPRGKLQFLFLPPNAPTKFSARSTMRLFLRAFERPLLATTAGTDASAASLRKKSNKSRLNQLQRLGPLTFERITDPHAFAVFLDEMIPLLDARQVALSGTAPFRADPRKRALLHEMLRRGILHVTAMRVGGRLVAGHVGVINGRQVVLGMIPHSPFFAKYSPGKFQLLLLAGEMQREGFEAFDLTPGGEYKDRFASHHDQAHVLTVFLSSVDAWRYRLARTFIDVGKRYVSVDTVKKARTLIRHKAGLVRAGQIPRQLVRRLARLAWDRREHRLYVLDTEAAGRLPCTPVMRRDALEDLLRYEPAEAWQPTKQEFLRTGLARLGEGHHFYARVVDGRLAHWGWLLEEEATSRLAEVDHLVTWPPRSAVLFDFYTRPEYRGRGFYGAALRQMIGDAARIPGAQHVVISVCARNRASRRPLEACGFRHWHSVYRKRFLWRTWQWDGGNASVLAPSTR